jgi:hypothetical protein
MLKFKESILIFFAVCLALPISFAFANAGLPMIIVGLPNLIFALIPVVIIEALYLHKRHNLNFIKSLKAFGWANILTTFIGFPLTWGCLFGLQLLFGLMLGGSCSPGFDNIFYSIISVLTHAAWLCPWEGKMVWLIPLALMQCLIVAYFVSAYLEALVIKKIFKEENSKTISKAVWQANSITYSILILINLVLMTYNLIK